MNTYDKEIRKVWKRIIRILAVIKLFNCRVNFFEFVDRLVYLVNQIEFYLDNCPFLSSSFFNSNIYLATRLKVSSTN